MKKEIFTGAGVAIITPFTKDGVDFDKLGQLIEYQINNKTDCIIICGTTGEASTMPDEEHIATIKYAVEKVNRRVPVIAGAGSNDTKHAIKLTKASKDLGADAILSVSPYYNKTTQEGLYTHFSTIADNVDIPMVLYNVPSRTGMNINPETVGKLAKHENIVAIKECNINQIGDVINATPDDFSIYSGEDGLVVPLLAMGGKGVISVMANIVPEKTHDMVQSFLDGDVKKSREIQLELLGLINALFCETNPIPVKAAVNLMGFDVGDVRLPLVNASDKAVSLLRTEMGKLGLLDIIK